ncbi:MAG: T9SS type A sorting domain-containing protein, partial [Flavobacteriales bacterium]
DGDYAVIVKRGVCVDTSDCVNINTASIYENNLINLFTIYPNPANSVIRITSSNDLKIKSAIIIDLTGKVVLTSNNSFSEIDIQKLPKGMYFLELNTEKGITTMRFVKS